jgi:hypothetical protein
MRYLRTALVAAVLTAAFVVPSNASAQITTFQIGTSAQLGPEGITAVPVLVNCDAGFQANLTVAVAQATGKRMSLFVNTPVPGGEFAFATVEPQELRIRK